MGLFSNKRGMAGVFISFLLIALLALFAAKGIRIMWCLTYDMRFLPLFSPLLPGFFWLSGNGEEGRIKEITTRSLHR